MKDAVELKELYQEYALPVKKYVLSLCRNETIAEDVVADTFYKAIKNIDSFQGGKVLTWLCTIAKHTYFDYVKKKEYSNLALTGELTEQIPDEQLQPEQAMLQKEDRTQLYRMLQKLSSEERDVVYLRIFADLSFREIGDILGKSENWARVIFYRSKNKLKGWMENEHEATM